MNSLVVFLSVVAFAVAKPSGSYDAGLLTYSSPIIAAAPAAVSSQSRLDIQSSPAIVETKIQPVSRTVISEPSFLAGPAIAAPAAYAAPTVYAAPAAYAAPVAVAAPAAVSHQSRLDIKTSPAITSTVVSAPVAYSAPIAAPVAYAAPSVYSTSAAYAAPAVYAAPAAYTASSAVSQQSRLDIKSSPAITSTIVSAPVTYSATAAIAPTYVKTSFTGPAIGYPAFIKSAEIVPSAIGAPAVPLDTPEVVAARAAHYEAKALAEGHLIRKRSVLAGPLLSTHVATPVISTYAAAPLVSTYSAPIYSAPLSYSAAISTPIVTKAYGIHPW